MQYNELVRLESNRVHTWLTENVKKIDESHTENAARSAIGVHISDSWIKTYHCGHRYAMIMLLILRSGGSVFCMCIILV